MSVKMLVIKANRYGMKQRRIVWLDAHDAVMRFLGTDNVMKTAYPFKEVASIRKKDPAKPEKVLIEFKSKASRPYDIVFVSGRHRADLVTLV